MHVIGNTPWYISIGIFSHQLQNQTFLYLSHLEKEFKKLVAFKKKGLSMVLFTRLQYFFSLKKPSSIICAPLSKKSPL
jgi:16S rRNA A1518/A1519 N6-dimethyltransferase RsmA/KsgA/DIM1 with predicted DNA glycosylase/AP lyase activity